MPLNLLQTGFSSLKQCVLFILFLTLSIFCQAQTIDTIQEVELTEVQVKAFEQNRRLRDVPASVSHVGRTVLERFSSSSVVHAINTMPGVRMEERSPGSYRFNIRGSSLRSPFGVRNIKVYFNDIPYTDPGGHTYLNQLGYHNFSSIDIIKGPGSSLYGAGTGGVLLVNSLSDNEQPGVFAEYTAGSFNLQNAYISLTTGTKKWISKTGFQQQQNDGYRSHSALRRNVLSWSSSFQFDSTRQLRASFLYGDLEYETPGALSLSEYEANPRQARPGNAFFPGAEQANAGVHQKTFVAGFSYTQMLTRNIQSKTTLYGIYTQLRNPTIQNYGRNSEPHVGGRSVFKWTKPLTSGSLTINAGAEWQQGFSSYTIHDNKFGQPDTLRAYNEVNNRQSFVFTQATVEKYNWLLLLGISTNQRRVDFRIFEPTVLPEQNKKFNNELAPRLALLKKWKKLTAYTSVSRGFSPPTTEELFPSGGEINLELNAEDGINYDVGLRGQLGNLSIDINAFQFSLKNTIVQRRTAGGGSYFTNAGKTDQQGVEVLANYQLFSNSALIDRSFFWTSYTWHNFNYKDFKQVTSDYSNNQLPGVAPHSIASGFDLAIRNGLQATITYYYNAKTPLNDANTSFADAFHLLGLKLGYQKWFKEKWHLKLVAGTENLLDERYSLGNDINGFGGRYYNAAPGRNFYTSLIFQWLK
jgi:iron complex outermembrane receptor protein